MPAIDEILPQSTPQNDVQHSFRRFLKLDVGGRGHLLRILGVGFGLAVGVGNTIGTGILRTPGEVAGYLGNGQLVFAVWLLGGIYALLCSSPVTELGCMLPRAGGWYVYSHRAFGEKAGFVVGCCDWTVPVRRQRIPGLRFRRICRRICAPARGTCEAFGGRGVSIARSSELDRP